MSYVVIWVYSNTDHLKAVSNDGVHGYANCQFPRELDGYGLSRFDTSNVFAAFEVSDLAWGGSYYRVPAKKVIRALPKLSQATIPGLWQESDAWTVELYKKYLAKDGIEFEGNMASVASSNKLELNPADFPDAENEINQQSTETPMKSRSIKKTKVSADWFGESMKKFNIFNLEESLFENIGKKFRLIEADEEGNDIETKKPLNFNTEKSSDVQAKEAALDLMIGSPVFANGNPKMESWILIKLYEACINPGTSATTPRQKYTDLVTGEMLTYPGITRAELLKRVGTALHETPAQSQTFFDLFKEIGLAYINPTGENSNTVFPGTYLKDWVEGKDLQLEVPWNGKSYERQYHYDSKGNRRDRPYGGGVDLRKFVNQGNLAKKTPASSATLRADGTGYGDDPFVDFPGITVVANPNQAKKATPEPAYETTPLSATVQPKKPAKPEEPAVTPTKQKVVKKAKIPAGWFSEELNEEESFDDTPSYRDGIEARKAERESAFIEQVKKAYREHCNLEEDADIVDKFDDFQFRGVCCNHNWPYESTKEKIWGKGNN